MTKVSLNRMSKELNNMDEARRVVTAYLTGWSLALLLFGALIGVGFARTAGWGHCP